MSAASRFSSRLVPRPPVPMIPIRGSPDVKAMPITGSSLGFWFLGTEVSKAHAYRRKSSNSQKVPPGEIFYQVWHFLFHIAPDS